MILKGGKFKGREISTLSDSELREAQEEAYDSDTKYYEAMTELHVRNFERLERIESKLDSIISKL